MLLHDNGLIKVSCDFDPLIESGSESSLRLLFEYAGRYGFDLLTDEQVVLVIKKVYINRLLQDRRYSAPFSLINGQNFLSKYPTSKIFKILDDIRHEISKINKKKDSFNSEAIAEINNLVIFLLQRYIQVSKNIIDPLMFYKNITLFDDFYIYNVDKSISNFFQDYFHNHQQEKLKIQEYLSDTSKGVSIYSISQTPFCALTPTKEDLLKLVDIVQKRKISNQNIKKWKSIINLYCNHEAILESDQMYQSALGYAVENKLLSFLNLKKEVFVSEWKIKSVKRARKYKLKRKLAHQKARNDLYPYINEIEKGNPDFCNYPANLLLGRHYDIPDDLKNIEKIKYILKDNLTESAIKGFESSLHNPVPSVAQLTKNKYPIEPVLIAGIYCRLLRNENFNDLSNEVILACAVILDFNHTFSHLTYDKNQPNLYLYEIVKQEIIKRGLKKRIVDEMFIPQFETDEAYINGLHWVYGETVDQFSIDTIVYLLNSYPKMQQQIQNRFIDTLINNDELLRIDSLIKTNAKSLQLDEDRYPKNVRWLALLSLIDNNKFYQYMRCVEYPKLVFWQLKETYQETYLTKNPKMSLFLASWIAYRFSYIFPNIERPSGVSSGNRNDWQASEFIIFCLYQVSGFTTLEARNELQKLKAYVHPSYQEFTINLLFEQSTRLREANYQSPRLADVLNILQNKAPENCKDLKTLILFLLEEIQAKIKASELDSFKMFYEDGKSKEPEKPHDENYCRDRLADLMKPYIESYNLRLDTEKDMPNDKRADLVCSSSKMQLPIEVKGQWHPDLWTAMNDQLGDLYLKEYQSQGQGIYLVFYFGNNPTKNLKSNKKYRPQNAIELQENLTDCIDDKYKDGIGVFVLDLSI